MVRGIHQLRYRMVNSVELETGLYVNMPVEFVECTATASKPFDSGSFNDIDE
jgi:hypothetical protein